MQQKKLLLIKYTLFDRVSQGNSLLSVLRSIIFTVSVHKFEYSRTLCLHAAALQTVGYAISPPI